MRRRGGLLGTAARTAVIAGTATSVSGRVARRQQQKFAGDANSKTARPTHATASDADLVDSLQRLADLKASGALSEKEYAAAKAKVLA